MKRGKSSTKRPRKKALPPMPLVPVDEERIRRETQQEYDEVWRELEKAREDLDYFHREDLPKFNQWISKQFGQLLTEIRETSHLLQEKHLLLIEIEREVMYNGISHAGAFERVMDRHNQEDNAEEQEKEPNGKERTESDFEEDEAEFEGAFRESVRGKHDGQAELSKDAKARLKELYRAVVRKLHPDTQKKMTAQKLEWWHQAQAAYENGQAEQLEVILSLCEIEEAGTTEKTSLSVLKRLITQFRSSLRQVQNQLVKCRHEPAWRFSRRRNCEDLEKEIGAQLKHDLRIMKQELRFVEQQLEAWELEAKGGRPTHLYHHFWRTGI